jgi:hypothetical protein
VLESQRAEARINLYEPVADEVMGGLFARVFRFLQTLVLDYHLWADDLGRVVLRMMLESVFYMRFLADQPELFLAFQNCGISQEKLYKMQLRKLLEEGKLEDSAELRNFIDSDSDEEIADELVNVRLKNFEDLRKLATDVGMKDNTYCTIKRKARLFMGTGPPCGGTTWRCAMNPFTDYICNRIFALPPLNPQLLDRAFLIVYYGLRPLD